MYHWTPASNLLTNLYPGDTCIEKFIIIPVLCPQKIYPLAISVSMNILLNDIISTGLGERLYSSYIVVLLSRRRSLILSLGTNVNTGP